MVRTTLGSVVFFIAYLAIVAVAIDAFDAGRRLDGAFAIAAAALISIGFWWEDRAVRRIRGQTDMLRQVNQAFESHIRGATDIDTKASEHSRQSA
jgi:hypothetical protein